VLKTSKKQGKYRRNFGGASSGDEWWNEKSEAQLTRDEYMASCGDLEKDKYHRDVIVSNFVKYVRSINLHKVEIYGKEYLVFEYIHMQDFNYDYFYKYTMKKLGDMLSGFTDKNVIYKITRIRKDKQVRAIRINKRWLELVP
jgi:hypothetical protein